NESALQGRIASLRMQGCYSDASDAAAEALERRGASPGIVSEKGWLSLERGDLVEAIDAFENVVQLTPRDPFSHLNLAAALVRRGAAGGLDRATARCRQARRLEPDLCESFWMLGFIASKRGDMQEAEANYLRSVELTVAGGPQAAIMDQIQGTGLRYADL